MFALFAVAVDSEIVGKGRFAGVICGELADCDASAFFEDLSGQKDRRLVRVAGREALSAGEDDGLEKGLDKRRGIARVWRNGMVEECSRTIASPGFSPAGVSRESSGWLADGAWDKEVSEEGSGSGAVEKMS